MKNIQSGFIGIGSVDISEHFDMMEQGVYGFARSVQKYIYMENEKRHPFNKS